MWQFEKLSIAAGSGCPRSLRQLTSGTEVDQRRTAC